MPLADPFDDKYAHLNEFPDHILRDIGRNESAPRDYRKFAVELLIVRKSPLVKHEDLKEFVYELEVELDGIEFEHKPEGPGPLSASVTTKTMFGTPDPGFTGFDFEIPYPTPPVPSKPRTKPKPKDTPDATTG